MRILAWAILMGSVAAQADEAPSVGKEVYARAERFLSWNRDRAVYNNNLDHHWIGGADALWYRRVSEQGTQFVLAEPARARKRPAFDHARMAIALGKALGRELTADHLPISALEFVRGPAATPRVFVNGREFDCDLARTSCVEQKNPERDAARAYSPDGRYAVFTKGPNLWVSDLKTGEERALTTDGEDHEAYGAVPESSGMSVSERRRNKVRPPMGKFSPDGSRFITYRLDESRVPELSLLQNLPEDGSFRPKIWSYRYPFPGETQPRAALFIFDLKSGQRVQVEHEPLIAQVYGPILMGQISWAPDGRAVYILDNRGDYKELSLSRALADSGKTTHLLTESSSSNTLIDPNGQGAPTRAFLSNGDFIWSSERSGWQHLYLYDRFGHLKNPITSGPWLVREILKIDEATRSIFFSAGGREAGDPYLRHIYRVGFDGSGLRRLSMQDADHEVKTVAGEFRKLEPSLPGPDEAGFSPSGRFFVDSYSRPDLPTVTVIRDRSGRVVMQLETAHADASIAAHYLPPESFKATAADGETVLYGLLFKPSDFDPERVYPVIDTSYPGPQQTAVPKRFLVNGFLAGTAQALAELGFIVVAVDGRGTPLRSRAFRDASYGKLGKAGFLEDHVAVIKALASSRPYMNLDRVGIYGASAGGFSTVHALFDYPDFFKVGVAFTGNHDLRSYMAVWGERYQGPYDSEQYAAAASYANAANFKGKLLLAHGDMDDNVHPANTLRVVDALIRNNKTFDLLIIPNANHGSVGQNPYFIRRLWDYFIINLQGARPPPDYVIAHDR